MKISHSFGDTHFYFEEEETTVTIHSFGMLTITQEGEYHDISVSVSKDVLEFIKDFWLLDQERVHERLNFQNERTNARNKASMEKKQAEWDKEEAELEERRAKRKYDLTKHNCVSCGIEWQSDTKDKQDFCEFCLKEE